MPKIISKKKTLVLLDTHAIIHRAYHALPDFSSSKGEPTGALYGLSTMLFGIIKEYKPDYIVACYDLPQPTYRHEAYEEYKAGRAKADEALVAQLEKSKKVFEAFQIPMYSLAGFEADDMLGTIVEKTKKEKDLDIIIASGDMDTLQLVSNSKVRVYTLKKGIRDTIIYNEHSVKKRFGFGPELLPDFKGLRGDPSDNIIGIKGIGEKTATILITKFGSIEKIYSTLKKHPEKFKEAGLSPRIIALLSDNEEEAIFSKMLATIRRDAPINFSLPPKTWKDSLDKEKISRIFDELDFRSLKTRVNELFESTTSIKAKKAAEGELRSYEREETPKQETLMAIETKASPEEIEKTLIAFWVLNSDSANPTLDDLYQFTKVKTFDEAKSIIFQRLEKENLKKVFEEIELPLMPVVKSMNAHGITIDRDYLEELSEKYHKELLLLESGIWTLAGEEFNVNSSQQLGKILFGKLNLALPHHKKTTTGIKSTKESELEKMRDSHPIIEKVLRYREFQKLLSTYIDAIPKLLSEDGRLRATFLQAGTTTGRMASHNPNLQNIPIKTELGRNIRNAFVATEGFVLVSFDYSQVELRIAAFLSGEEKLIEVFRKGGDVHTAVASRIFNVPEGGVDKEMRRRAKVINFGILYGMGVNALRTNLGTDRKDAQQFYNTYFENFKKLSSYLEHIKLNALQKGFTETFFGRRRYFKALQSPIPYIRAAAERMAINAPFQGTSADIIKIAMGNVYQYISKNNLQNDVSLLLQVHDELVYEIKEDYVKDIIPHIHFIMENVIDKEKTKGVPLEVNVEMGKRWGEMNTHSLS
ncbi:MAG: DNA polymerase [Patescibacteria group bacterium]